MKWLLVLCACLAAPLVLRAEGAAEQPAASTQVTAVPGNAIDIKIGNFKFVPAEVTVAAGTRLSWLNQDDAPHLVIGTDPNSPIKSPPLDTDEQYSIVLAKPGTYRYFCSLHPQMTGTIVVR
jgi:plastocyanin